MPSDRRYGRSSSFWPSSLTYLRHTTIPRIYGSRVNFLMPSVCTLPQGVVPRGRTTWNYCICFSTTVSPPPHPRPLIVVPNPIGSEDPRGCLPSFPCICTDIYWCKPYKPLRVCLKSAKAINPILIASREGAGGLEGGVGFEETRFLIDRGVLHRESGTRKQSSTLVILIFDCT